MPETPDRSPIADAAISVVLLASSGDPNLRQSLQAWVAYLDSPTRDYEILLVFMDSTNPSLPETEGLAALSPQVRVLVQPTATDVGAAIRTGLAAARFPLVCYVECSPAYQPADLAKMLDLIDHVDLVCGYREGKAWRRQASWKSVAFRWLMRLVLGVHLKDVDCPFKLCRRSIFARIPIQSESPLVHAEMVAKANFLGCLIAEVPVSCLQTQTTERQSLSQQQWLEALQLIRHPDFGPARLADAQEAASGAAENLTEGR